MLSITFICNMERVWIYISNAQQFVDEESTVRIRQKSWRYVKIWRQIKKIELKTYNTLHMPMRIYEDKGTFRKKYNPFESILMRQIEAFHSFVLWLNAEKTTDKQS